MGVHKVDQTLQTFIDHPIPVRLVHIPPRWDGFWEHLRQPLDHRSHPRPRQQRTSVRPPAPTQHIGPLPHPGQPTKAQPPRHHLPFVPPHPPHPPSAPHEHTDIHLDPVIGNRSPFLKKCLVSRAFDGVEVSGLCGRDVEGVGMWAR